MVRSCLRSPREGRLRMVASLEDGGWGTFDVDGRRERPAGRGQQPRSPQTAIRLGEACPQLAILDTTVFAIGYCPLTAVDRTSGQVVRKRYEWVCVPISQSNDMA